MEAKYYVIVIVILNIAQFLTVIPITLQATTNWDQVDSLRFEHFELT